MFFIFFIIFTVVFYNIPESFVRGFVVSSHVGTTSDDTFSTTSLVLPWHDVPTNFGYFKSHWTGCVFYNRLDGNRFRGCTCVLTGLLFSSHRQRFSRLNIRSITPNKKPTRKTAKLKLDFNKKPSKAARPGPFTQLFSFWNFEMKQFSSVCIWLSVQF